MKINYKPNKEEQKEIIELVENEKYYYSFNYFNDHKKDFSEDTNSDEYKIYEYLSEFFDILKNEYILSFEIHESLGNKLKSLAGKYFPNDKIIIKQDDNSLDRYLYIVSGDYK